MKLTVANVFQLHIGRPSATYHYAVFCGEYGKLIEAGDKIPTRGDVASYEDAKREDREGVHRALFLLAVHAARYIRYVDSEAVGCVVWGSSGRTNGHGWNQ